ncbi:MAG: peptide-methionine (S)-S-oxide reductase MsrA [Bacteroidota bacterium]
MATLYGNRKMNDKSELATFGGGCFWCVETIFERVKGVQTAESGYSGGHIPDPDYTQVTTGLSGHAEVVQITFDPEQVSYTDLLEIFFKTHDPTTLNRQGNDVGTQYRSVIFYHSEEQREEAENVIALLASEEIWNDPIVTSVEAYEAFYKAEGYHQEYFENNPSQGYCRIVINPKVEKFEKAFREKLK